MILIIKIILKSKLLESSISRAFKGIKIKKMKQVFFSDFGHLTNPIPC